MLIAIGLVLMYLLCIDDYYRVKVLRWIGFDLIVAGKVSAEKKEGRIRFVTFANFFTPNLRTCILPPALTCTNLMNFVNFFRSLWNNRTNHLWSWRWWKILHAGLGAKLPLMVLRSCLCWCGLYVCCGSSLHSGGTNHATQRDCSWKPRKTAVSYGANSLVRSVLDRLSYLWSQPLSLSPLSILLRGKTVGNSEYLLIRLDSSLHPYIMYGFVKFFGPHNQRKIHEDKVNVLLKGS